MNTAKLKAAAEKAKDDFRPNVVVSTRDVLELIAALEAAEKRIAELEARKFRLPESVIDAICHTAAEIHNLGRGVSDDRAQEIINSIRCAAGINLETGGE
ncbi:hypothetical protein SM003_004182 [Cronobacter malonaticus]|nr:hypothetical protein [Cronobacter malonaticus]